MRITLDIPYFAAPGLRQDAAARGITPEEILLEILTELYGSYEEFEPARAMIQNAGFDPELDEEEIGWIPTEN